LKQAWLIRPGKVAVKEVPFSTEEIKLKKGELLVRIKAALTCGTDLKAYLRGHKLIPMPGPLGHEFSGIVVKAGKSTPFKKGTEIMSVHTAPCGACLYCKKGLENLCENIMDTKILGAFGEYLVIPSHIVKRNVFKKPKSLSFEEASFLEPLSCVVHGLAGRGLRKGGSALIFGAGPIGLLHLILLRKKGVRTAICALEPQRLALARRLGAELAVKPDKLTSSLKRAFPLGVDFVFECTGRKNIWEESVNYLRRGGTAVLFGGLPRGTEITWLADKIHYDEITLKGSFHYRPEDVKEAYGLLAKRKIDVKPLISGEFRLEEMEKALRNLSKGKGIKYVIRPE
jgi:L-iditol 2-dehydrogenase